MPPEPSGTRTASTADQADRAQSASSGPGLAFVLVPRHSTDHARGLAELLNRTETMPVVEVQTTVPVVPDHVYVIPSAQELLVREGKLQFLPRGEPAEVATFTVPASDVGRRFVVGMVEGLSRRVHSAEEGRVREIRFRELADRAPVLMWVAGTDGYRFVNHSYLAFVGAGQDELLGGGWMTYLHPDDRQPYADALGHAIDHLMPFEQQFRHRNAAGEYRWMMSIAEPRFGPDGLFAGHVGSTFDVTEFKAAETILLAADEAKNTFITMLAHELRNPLSALLSASQIMATEEATPAQLTVAQAIIHRQLGNLARMVDDLLDASRVTHGKVELRWEQVEMQALLKRCAEQARESGQRAGIVLELDLPDQPIVVRGDPMRLEQIFSNLITNAFKFSSAGGHVQVEGHILHTPLGPQAELVVRDDGQGIDHAMLARIFDLFVQGDSSPGRSNTGLGIGLSLVRNLAELHGGTVKASSRGLGRGSSFTVCLPLTP